MKLNHHIENCTNSVVVRKWKHKFKNTEMWHMWFMGHFMAVSGFLAGEGEQAVSEHFAWEKKALGWLNQCSVSSLSVCNFSTLSLFVSFFLTACILPQSLLSASLLFFFLSVSPSPSPVALCSISLSCAWVLLRVWVYGKLCQCRHCHLYSFSLVRWRFNPFLTLHFHMLRQQSGLVAFFFLNWGFVTGK